MPQYFCHLAREENRLACIHETAGTVEWDGASLATAFDSPQQAREATLAAIRATFDAHVSAPRETMLDQMRTAQWGKSTFNGPAWMRTWVGYDTAEDRLTFEPALDELIVVAKSSDADLLAPFDSFHVRGEWGWLRERGGSREDWSPHFNDSKSFGSLEDAERGALAAGGPPGHAVFRARSQFEQATITGDPGHEASALAASCEAKQIGADAAPASKARAPGSGRV